jgi:hypothetical protein
MNKIDHLAGNYSRHLEVPWQSSVSGAQKVMLLIYDKELERSLRACIGEFEIKTRDAGYNWVEHNFTHAFSKWLAADDYRDAYFEEPEDLTMKIEGEFKEHVIVSLRTQLREADDQTVVALTGIAALYGFVHVSELVRAVEPDIRGRLIVFFPGTKEGSNYRLLDARDGWNYLANSITTQNTAALHDNTLPKSGDLF